MILVAIVTGSVLGALAAIFWHVVTRRVNVQPLFSALGRSVRAMLSDDGNFLREYCALLVCVGSFVFWNVLALSAALVPIVVVWPFFEGNHILLVAVYSVISMGGVFYLRSRFKKRPSGLEDDKGLSVSNSQFFFLQVVESAPWLMHKVASFESSCLRRRLDSIEIDRPVFIAGLARSGTTMLLELLAQVGGVATHRYRDFPFLMTPYFWNQYVRLFGAKQDSVQRPHQDGIHITPDSPEAFEEPIWQSFFPDAHRMSASHVLGRNDENLVFNELFMEHIKKILLIRNGMRYVSKGNYNATRIEYISSIFPDARFVIPIRHPAPHVASLVRQHELFCDYSSRDPRVPQYLSAAGHFEFGPQRVPISIDGSADQTLSAWQAGREHLGYAIQWAAVYGFIFEMLQWWPALAERVMVVRYEDICDNPPDEMSRVLAHVGLEDQGQIVLDHLDHIKGPNRHPNSDDPYSETVWATTERVASKIGYDSMGIRSGTIPLLTVGIPSVPWAPGPCIG